MGPTPNLTECNEITVESLPDDKYIVQWIATKSLSDQAQSVNLE